MVFDYFQRKVFYKGLKDSNFFKRIVRRAVYLLNNNDSEEVHDFTLNILNKYEDIILNESKNFDFPDLYLKLNGRKIKPFGTAAGLDKNGSAIAPLSHLFGFLELGTVIVNSRDGNKKPRVFVDEKNEEIYNAQGFPSKGLEYFLKNIKEYREKGGNAYLLVSVCGIPSDENKLDYAFKELENLVSEINPYADGFVWNPFSPNTSALSALRNPNEFERNAKLVREISGNKLNLVKMGPYDLEKRQEWLELVRSWLNGGGDGIVAVNTYLVPKEKIPVKNWGYKSAGRSGRFEQVYRQRAVKSARINFPNSVIIATGGIDSAYQALSAFEAGANAVEGYTPYTFYGFSLLKEICLDIRKIIHKQNCKTLEQYLEQKKMQNYL